MMFEITPKSYHGSRSNNSTYRDALFGWFHSEMKYSKKKFSMHDLCANVRMSDWKPSKNTTTYGQQVTGDKSK